jgi:hypothetical protein
MFCIKVFAIVTFVQPIVPFGPLTWNVIVLLVESKVSPVIVEFEIIEKGIDQTVIIFAPTMSLIVVKP